MSESSSEFPKQAPDRKGATWQEGQRYDGQVKDDRNEWKAGIQAAFEPSPEDMEPAKIAGKTPQGWQEYLTKQMDAANKRLRTFRKQGNAVVDQYLDQRVSNTDQRDKDHVFKLNLFHTNVATQEAMLYGRTPKVDVSREYADPNDDVARVASIILQRMLQADVEPSGDGTAAVLRQCLQDRLLPGLGLARVRYEYDAQMTNALDPATMEVTEVEEVTSERAPIDYVNWQDVAWGWCRVWPELPWLGFRAYMTKVEVEKRFGATIAKALQYKNQLPISSDEKDGKKEQENVTKKAEVWEIWHRGTGMVFFYAKGQPAILDAIEDPLQLDGFWPVPKALMANLTTRLLEPKADFVIAQDLYHQVNELSTRISIITDAVKVVGVYDQSAGGSVGRMLKEGLENDLIPVDNWAMFAEKGGLQGTMDWFPIQDIVGVLQTLKQVLADTIDQLYQITGMSDVLRGANTDQYTSDGTNQLKAKFGSIRVQALQDEFARFASDLEALKAEVIAKHFEDRSILEQSGAGFLSQADQQYIPQALALIRSPMAKFRIDIRPESIAMIDYAQIKAERTEFLNAMATYIQSAQAMIQQEPGSLPVLMEMMKWAMAGFKGAKELEGIMDQAIDQAIQAQQQQQGQQEPSPEQMKLQTEQIKAQAQQAKGQMELQKIQAKAAADMQAAQSKLQSEMMKIQADLQSDERMERMSASNRMQELMQAHANDMARIEAELRSAVTIERTQAAADMASNRQEHNFTLTEIAAQRNDAA